MAIGLRDGVSVTTTSLAADDVGLENSAVGFGMMAFKPREQRGAKVETYLFVIVYRALDGLFRADNVRLSVGRVAFGMNALIPVVIRSGAKLALDISGPGILAWWLVKVSVNY